MKVLDGLQIRDTNPHNSAVREYPRYLKVDRCTVIFKNGLDKDVSLQVQGSVDKDFTVPVDIGNAIVAPANMTKGDYEWFMAYFPYVRVVATCSEAPTSGALDVWIEP